MIILGGFEIKKIYKLIYEILNIFEKLMYNIYIFINLFYLVYCELNYCLRYIILRIIWISKDLVVYKYWFLLIEMILEYVIFIW